MASLSPSTASNDWLLRATAKLKKSIFRMAEYKYKTKIKQLEKQVKEYDLDIDRLLHENILLEDKCEELEGKLNLFTKPEVGIKDIQTEIFKVKPIVEKIALGNVEQIREKFNDDVNVIGVMKDSTPKEILKIAPVPPRSILPPPAIPKKNIKNKKRERSTSPKPTPLPPQDKMNLKKRDRSESPQPTISPYSTIEVSLEGTGHWKKRKKDKGKKKKS